MFPPVWENGEPVSSTRIRTAIQNGDMESANQMLGYPWQFREKVVLGNQLGRTMNYPTINQIFPKELVLPKLGVYISATEIHGKRFPSITNIGFKPTIGGVTSPLAGNPYFGLFGRIIWAGNHGFSVSLPARGKEI